MWFGMSTGQVRKAGHAVGAFASQAGVVATGCLDALSDCAGVVEHPEVAAALRDYRDGVVPTAQAMPAEIDSLSARAAHAADDIESADEEALSEMLLPWQTSERLAGTLLHTRLNAGEHP